MKKAQYTPFLSETCLSAWHPDCSGRVLLLVITGNQKQIKSKQSWRNSPIQRAALKQSCVFVVHCPGSVWVL